MGHKKRNSVARPRQSPAAAANDPLVDVASEASTSAGNGVSETRAESPNPNETRAKAESPQRNGSDSGGGGGGGGGGAGSASLAAVKVECERALTAYRRGNHTKALRLMKELSQRHEGSPHFALIQRAHGAMSFKVAAHIDDPAAKNRHMRAALEAARKAAELSPDSIEFALFHASLLYETASEAKEYEEAVRECDRGLAIENPVDPAMDSLPETEQKAATVEGRVLQVQNDLRQLIQKSNISSISSWMKNLGNGDEKFRLIPLRRVAEDPLELRLVQARRPNEIKKALKTPEERRKEIEVRVAAARLMQQKSDATPSENGSDSSPATGQRVPERRKSGNTRKNGSSSERRDFVRSFWTSVSAETKRELLRIRVSDLKEHTGSLKESLAGDVLSEALSFAESHKTWKLWVCCKCSEMFADSESHSRHVAQEHMGTLSPKLQSAVPRIVDDEWSEILLNYSWKPLDVVAAVNIVRNQSKCNDTDFVDGYHLVDNGDFGDCFKDTWGSSPEEGNLGSNCNGFNNVERASNGKIPDTGPNDCREENGSLPFSSLAESWPISDDPEHAKLLEKVRAVFEVLIKNKSLTGSLLSRVIQYAMGELQTSTSGSQLINHGIELSPACICFLGEANLKKILKYLQDIAHSCGLGTRYSEKGSNLKDDANAGRRSLEIKERIVLSEDSSFLLLDEGLLGAEFGLSNNNHGSPNNAVDGNTDEVLADSNGMLSWIFVGPTSGEELASWMRKKEEKAREGVEILQRLEGDFYNLQSLCERKSEHLAYEEALQIVEDLCVEEGKKRESTREFFHQSFETVLKKRRDEILIIENNEMVSSNRAECDAIINVLKEAESLGVNQFGYEEMYGVSSQLCDLESGEDNEWRKKDCLQQADTCVEMALQRQKDHLYLELSKIDARLMRCVTEMQQMELKLEPIASHDFRAILLPLVKSYLRAHLEDLAEKHATEKSDAVREAFLAELALDSKKTPKGGNDNLRQTQEKSKDKKKNKDCRKPKDSKVTGVPEPYDETDDPVSSIPVASDDDHSDSRTPVLVNDDDLKRQKEEIRRKMELEEEERKLEETLEYQRRIENEAKQKHLAEQLKKTNQTYLEKVTEGLRDVHLESGPVGISVHEQIIPSVPEDLANNLEVFAAGTLNHSGLVQSSTVYSSQIASSEHQTKILQADLPNGGTVEDGYLPSERRGGKRVRRQKSLAKVSDGKHQLLLSGKEIVEVESSHLGGGLKEGDGGVKSLRQLQADDDEERFQADLEKAVQQSLDTFQAFKKFPSGSNLKTMQQVSEEVHNGDIVPNDAQIDNVSGDGVFGTGLKNEVGEYNCFLNVIIQSLWHIRRFRDEFLQRSSSEHVHIGDPCVVCALYEIFSALSVASTDTRREAVAPTTLRVALSNLYPDSSFFQEAQMNDASEVMAVIFNCLHQSFTLGSSSDTKPVVTSFMGSWDCTNDSCIAHTIFGMDIFERMNCYNCGLESRHFKYTSFFHNINASALRTMKVMCPKSSFDDLLNHVEMNHQLACDLDAVGCGKLNYIHRILSSPPHVFTTVLGWQNTCESIDDITDTLEAIDTDIDISVLYRGLDPKNLHSLVSVVCYYGQHYHCFAYSHDHGRWIMYDDQTVKVIGSWADVVAMCEKGHLQPQVLFFEAVN